MAYLAVDKDGTEMISDYTLFRSGYYKRYLNCRPESCGKYPCSGCKTDEDGKRYKDTRYSYPPRMDKEKAIELLSFWDNFEYDPDGNKLNFIIYLPKGTIRKLIGRNLTWEDEPIEYNETLYNITMNTLTYMFPDFIFRDGTAEIIGYNPKEHIHMVIEDGNCCTTDNKWIVHQYKIKNPETFNWLKWKYICFDEIAEKILEDWIEFK